MLAIIHNWNVNTASFPRLGGLTIRHGMTRFFRPDSNPVCCR